MSLNEKCVKITLKDLNNPQKVPNDKEKNTFLSLLRDHAASTQIKHVHIKYYHTMANLNLSVDEHLVHITKLLTHVVSRVDMEQLIKMVLDQTSNLFQLQLSSVDDRVAFARWCLNGSMMRLAVDNKLFTVEQFSTIVLCCLFENIHFDSLVAACKGRLSEVLVPYATEETYIALEQLLNNSGVIKSVAQFDFIMRNKIVLYDESYAGVYMSFVQRLFFKRMINGLRTESLMNAYQSTYILAMFLAQQSHHNECEDLISFLSGKAQSFYADIQTVDLVVNLCLPDLGIDDWSMLMMEARPLAIKQFLKYVKFANERLFSNQKIKKLMINKKYLDEATIIKVNDNVQTWFMKENETLTTNLVKVVTAAQMTPKLLIYWREVEVDYARLNNELYLSSSDMNIEDYKLLFDTRKLVQEDGTSIDKDKLDIFVAEHAPVDIDEQHAIHDQMRHLIFQYNRCINPPMSIQALVELRNKEHVCKRTNVARSLYQQDELTQLDEKERLVLEASKYAKGKFESHMKFSNYYCDSCNNAYKQICGEKTGDVLFGWDNDIQAKIHARDILLATKQSKNKIMSTLFRHACADMRALHMHSCFVEQEEKHVKEIVNRMW